MEIQTLRWVSKRPLDHPRACRNILFFVANVIFKIDCLNSEPQSVINVLVGYSRIENAVKFCRNVKIFKYNYQSPQATKNVYLSGPKTI
jgi:pantothenate kinase